MEPEQWYGFCEECGFTFCANCKQPYHSLDGGCSKVLTMPGNIVSGKATPQIQHELSPSGVKQTAASELDCPICISKMSVFIAIDFGCGHKFCPDCIKSFFETKINDRVTFGYTCPEPKCKAEADYSLIRGLLDNTGFQKYEEMLLDEAIARDMPEIVSVLCRFKKI